MLGSLAGLFSAVGLAVDDDDFSVVNEAINQSDNTGSIGEDIAPFRERSIRRNQRALLLVSATDELEEKISVAVGI